jgi:hypothetical protein
MPVRDTTWLAAQKGANGTDLTCTYAHVFRGRGVDFAGALCVAAANDHVGTLDTLLRARKFEACDRGTAIAAAAQHGNAAAFERLTARCGTLVLCHAMLRATDYKGDGAVLFLARAFPMLLETTLQHTSITGYPIRKLERIQSNLRACNM